MFSSKFAHIMRSHPTEAEAISRIAEYFSAQERRGGSGRLRLIKLDARRLQKIVDVRDASHLAKVIQVLLGENIIKRIVVINSPGGGGIAQYNSVSEVPLKIIDNRRGIEMDVTFDDIETYYIPVMLNG